MCLLLRLAFLNQDIQKIIQPENAKNLFSVVVCNKGMKQINLNRILKS